MTSSAGRSKSTTPWWGKGEGGRRIWHTELDRWALTGELILCFTSTSHSARQAARRSRRPNLHASRWASGTRCWEGKERPKQQVHTHPNRSRRGRTCTKVGKTNNSFLSIHKEKPSILIIFSVSLCMQMTPALPRIKGRGGRASQGWWGNLSRRSLQQESRLEWGWMTVLLRRTTRSALS